jgi:hypothetical protein
MQRQFIKPIFYLQNFVVNKHVVGIATDYGLDCRGAGVRVPVRAKYFSLSTSSIPALGLTQPLIQWITDAFPRR